MTKDERKIKAHDHYRKMEDEYSEEIDYSLSRSIIYRTSIDINTPLNKVKPKISVIPKTTETAILENNNLKFCVLNFASFTRPGGGFLNGSIAQEEALCHSSFLYNVLENFSSDYEKNCKKSKSGLYENFAIYSPDIYFVYNNSKIEIPTNIITCPAPNKRIYSGTNELYLEALNSRIKFILDLAFLKNQKNLILGAFGCGVFENNPETVAKTFKSHINNYNFENIIFAIPPGNENFHIFKELFSAQNP